MRCISNPPRSIRESCSRRPVFIVGTTIILLSFIHLQHGSWSEAGKRASATRAAGLFTKARRNAHGDFREIIPEELGRTRITRTHPRLLPRIRWHECVSASRSGGRRFRARACREGTSVPCRRSSRDHHRWRTARLHREHLVVAHETCSYP